MEDDVKIIFDGKELKDLRNEKVYIELDNSVERTAIDITEIQELSQKLSQVLPSRNSISGSGTMNIKKNTENYRRMQDFFEDCEAKALLETWRKLKDSDK